MIFARTRKDAERLRDRIGDGECTESLADAVELVTAGGGSRVVVVDGQAGGELLERAISALNAHGGRVVVLLSDGDPAIERFVRLGAYAYADPGRADLPAVLSEIVSVARRVARRAAQAHRQPPRRRRRLLH